MNSQELHQLKEAMKSLKGGDNNALEIIYNLTFRGVFTFVLPIVHVRQTAEDVTQDTYLKIFHQIDKYDETKNPLNWILTIAKNIALNLVTKGNKEMTTDWSVPIYENQLSIEDDDEYDTPVLNLAKEILSPSEYQIVTMFAVMEYKHREIAELLNIPLGTVTWKYNNAIKKLQKALKNKKL